MIAIGLRKKQALHAEPRASQQINVIADLDCAKNLFHS